MAFGSGWSEAGIYAQILSFCLFFSFISSPVSQLYIVMERQDFEIKINTLIFVSRCASIFSGGVLQNSRLAILLYSVLGVCVYGYMLVGLIGMANIGPANRVMKRLIRKSRFSLPYIGCLILLSLVELNSGPLLVLGICLVAGGYIVIAYKKILVKI